MKGTKENWRGQRKENLHGGKFGQFHKALFIQGTPGIDQMMSGIGPRQIEIKACIFTGLLQRLHAQWALHQDRLVASTGILLCFSLFLSPLPHFCMCAL